jgi:hypothetical protein
MNTRPKPGSIILTDDPLATGALLQAAELARKRDSWKHYKKISMRRLRRSKLVRFVPLEKRTYGRASFVLPLPLLAFCGFLLLFLFSPSSLFASSEDPCATLPSQPGDDMKTEITVGEMRSALCYASAYDAEKESRLKLDDQLTKLLDDYTKVTNLNQQLERQLRAAKAWIGVLAGVSAGTSVAFLISIIVQALK